MSELTTTLELSFSERHEQPLPLVLMNVWDGASAAICQQLVAQQTQSERQKAPPVALATSSASVAWSLGYADGDQLPVAELLAAVERLQRVVTLPLSVDIELGYSNEVKQVAQLVQQLCDLGVVGINIEDGNQPDSLLCEKIAAIKALLGSRIFVNARTDVYLQNLVPEQQQLEETLRRVAMYVKAGADGIFVPGVMERKACETLCLQSVLPVNIMLSDTGDLNQSALKIFAEMGIKRLSLGPAPFLACYQSLPAQFGCFSANRHEIGNTQPTLDYFAMNNLFADGRPAGS